MTPPRERFGRSSQASALLLLTLQLLLGALPHSERPGSRADRLQALADAPAAWHGGACQACVLGQAPAAPTAAPVGLTSFTTAAPVLAATSVGRVVHTFTNTHSRAPPLIAL